MTRLFAVALVLFVISPTAHSQFPGANSRGFIPPLFNLPENGEELRYTSSAQPEFPVPEFPVLEMQKGIESVVEVNLFVTSGGDVVYSEIAVSSGHDSFDDAALRSAMKAHFPEGYATVDGLPRDFRISVPYYFFLSEDPEGYWHSRLELARVQQEYEKVMDKFQDLLLARTTASESNVKEIQRRMEKKVAMAKRIHRLLAEKKECAILRIREEIDITKALAETRNDDSWRSQLQEAPTAAIQIASSGSSITTTASTGLEGVERLTHELDMKKGYM